MNDNDLRIIMDSLRWINSSSPPTKDDVVSLCNTSYPNKLAFLGMMDTYDILYMYHTRGQENKGSYNIK